MLQQTPVDRVIPAWTQWMQRWPTPADLAAAPPAEAIRAWGRLGYPRRALRLHAAAVSIEERHDGRVPDDETSLRARPGVGEYTAGAVLAFGFGRPALTLDTNVRRVIARHDAGQEFPSSSVTAGERSRALAMMPQPGGHRWMAALMELGALVCTSRAPACGECPVAPGCRWLALGRPPGTAPRPQARYAGSDREARGALLAVLRAHEGPVTQRRMDAAWPDARQRARALDGLVADGLVVPAPRGRWSLPALSPSG
ncbi:MAG: A/G-specific adenine glycosylase [bacterium]